MAPGVLRARLRRDRFFQLGLVLVALVVAAALLAPWIAPFDPLAGRPAERLPAGIPGAGSCWAPTPRAGTS